MRVLTGALVTVLVYVGSSALLAQSNDPFSIHVESNLVQVHVEVVSKSATGGTTSRSQQCGGALQDEFHSLLPSQPYLPGDCRDWMIDDLHAADFHVFEDGTEQAIQSVVTQTVTEMTARDSMGMHYEWSHTPRGKWRSTDVVGGLADQAMHFYSISYVPPKVGVGKCHSLLVTVNRPDAIVFAPRQYCHVPHAATDLLLGTDLGRQLDAELESDRKPKIPLLIQASFLNVGVHKARLNVVLEFPWDHLKHRCTSDGDMKANIGVLGEVYTEDHTVAVRFSDSATAGNIEGPHAKYGPRDCQAIAPGWLPSRYEAQVDLLPGNYQLRVILSDGEKFGRADMPISIDDYDGKQLALSSAILFKRFRNASAAAQEARYVHLAPQYVPLVSRGQQITPTADTTFSRKQLVPVYFEVYDPSLANDPTITVRAHARMVSVKSGEIRNFNWFDAAEFRRPDTTTFAIAKEFDPTGLPKGEYRLEVQASDSAGHTTGWQAAGFTLK